jgi:hypothetical protein
MVLRVTVTVMTRRIASHFCLQRRRANLLDGVAAAGLSAFCARLYGDRDGARIETDCAGARKHC